MLDLEKWVKKNAKAAEREAKKQAAAAKRDTDGNVVQGTKWATCKYITGYEKVQVTPTIQDVIPVYCGGRYLEADPIAIQNGTNLCGWHRPRDDGIDWTAAVDPYRESRKAAHMAIVLANPEATVTPQWTVAPHQRGIGADEVEGY